MQTPQHQPHASTHPTPKAQGQHTVALLHDAHAPCAQVVLLLMVFTSLDPVTTGQWRCMPLPAAGNASASATLGGAAANSSSIALPAFGGGILPACAVLAAADPPPSSLDNDWCALPAGRCVACVRLYLVHTAVPLDGRLATETAAHWFNIGMVQPPGADVSTCHLHLTAPHITSHYHQRCCDMITSYFMTRCRCDACD